MKNPKWLMKPLEINSSTFGFRMPGEGVIYKYKKSEHKYGEPTISYFVLTKSRTGDYFVFFFDSKRMGMHQIRYNTEINTDFSPTFKRVFIELAFKNTRNLSKAIDIMNEMEI